MYLSMSSCTIAMDDLASRLMAFRNFSSTTSVASYTKSSSRIYLKNKERKDKKRGHKKRRRSRHKPYLPNITCRLNHFSSCRLPVQAKRAKHQPHVQSDFQVLISLVGVQMPSWILKRASGCSRPQVASNSSRHL